MNEQVYREGGRRAVYSFSQGGLRRRPLLIDKYETGVGDGHIADQGMAKGSEEGRVPEGLSSKGNVFALWNEIGPGTIAASCKVVKRVVVDKYRFARNV